MGKELRVEVKPTNAFQGVFEFISYYPLFIVCFLVLASIFNAKLNGLIYLIGIIITCLLCLALSTMDDVKVHLPPECEWKSPWNTDHNIHNPSWHTAITGFTFIYLLIPMFQNIALLNPVVIAITSILAIANMFYLLWIDDCHKQHWGSVTGIFVGIFFGALWYFIVWSTNNKDLLFYNEFVSNNVVCNKPSQTTFKCHVYKNGELISSNMV